MRRVLILGIGNILQSDEGIGPRTARYIEENITLPEGVEVADGGTAGFDLLTIMKDRDKIVIIDALKADDEPGSVYRFPADSARGTRSYFSLHEVGIMEVIRMLRVLGDNPVIDFIGIVPEDINTFRIHISPSVEQSIPKAADQALDAAIN